VAGRQSRRTPSPSAEVNKRRAVSPLSLVPLNLTRLCLPPRFLLDDNRGKATRSVMLTAILSLKP